MKYSVIYGITLLSVCVIVIWVFADSQRPRIEKLEVSYDFQGIADVKGRNFRNIRGSVLLNSQVLDEEAILIWDTDRIRFVVPETFTAGLLSIDNGKRRSNTMLFLRSEHIIQEAQTKERVLAPRVATIGELIRVDLPFDMNLEELEFTYTNNLDETHSLPELYIEYLANNAVLLQIANRDIQNIRIQSPEKIVSIPLRVSPASSVNYQDPRTYFLSQTVLMTAEQVRDVRKLILVPRIQESLAQRNIRYTIAEPFPALYYSSDPLRRKIGVHVTRYREIWTPENVDFEQRYTYRFRKKYLEAVLLKTSLVPLVDTLLKNLAELSIESVQEVYSRMDASFIKENDLSSSDLASLLLYVLRELAIPAKLVHGYIKQDYLNVHTWVRFFVSGVGWVPVDPFYTNIYKPGSLEDTVDSVFYTDYVHIELEESRLVIDPVDGYQRQLVQILPPVDPVYSMNGRFFLVAEQGGPQILDQPLLNK